MKTSRLSPILVVVMVLAVSNLTAKDAKLAFRSEEGGAYSFDTGVLRGKLRPGGKSLGLMQVVHVPSGASMSRSYGLFSHYRVFTENHRYGGGAWDWPSEAALTNGSVEVYWPAAEGRPFEMWAVYRWAATDTLDLETRVKAHGELKNFESFLASYFAPAFTNSLAYAKGKKFLAAEPSEGVWQMFPRDESVMAMIEDGRWTIQPSPVKWVKRPSSRPRPSAWRLPKRKPRIAAMWVPAQRARWR